MSWKLKSKLQKLKRDIKIKLHAYTNQNTTETISKKVGSISIPDRINSNKNVNKIKIFRFLS